MADVNSIFWAPLCIVLIGLLLVAYEASRRANNKADAISAELLKLHQQLKNEEEGFKHTARQLAAHYDERVDGEKKKIQEVEVSHENVRRLAEILLDFVQREHPRWLQDRLDGKPERVLVFSDSPNAPLKGAALVKAQMRPPPKPRSPVGDATAKVLPPHPPASEEPVNFDDDDPAKK